MCCPCMSVAERRHHSTSSSKPPRTNKAVDLDSRVPDRRFSDTENLLKEELTVENYKEKFHALLDAEEQEHRKQLSVK